MTEATFTWDTTAPKFHDGAYSARTLILNVQRMVKQAGMNGSDFDVKAVAAQIQITLGCEGPMLAGFAGALADFLGSTLEGCPPCPDNWNPMERLTGD